MRPLLLAGLRTMRRHPGRALQVIFAVALGVALFVSSYVSIGGIEASIRRSSHALAGNAQWVVSGAGAGAVPESLVDRLRARPGLVAAPFLTASATTIGSNPERLQVWGVDIRSDAMVRLFGNRQAPDFAAGTRMFLVPDSVLLPYSVAADQGFSAGSTFRVATRSGPATLTVAGTVPDSSMTRALGTAVAFMDVGQAEQLFGEPGMVDSIMVAGVSEADLQSLAPGYSVRPIDALSPAAGDALLRMQSLYSVSVVAMLIGGFVVFGAVQVSVLERMKQYATFRALGASRLQLLSAILLEWMSVGLAGSSFGVLIGLTFSSVTLRAVTGNINSMTPLVHDARVEVSAGGVLFAIAVGLLAVFAAVIPPAWAAVRESPLLALRPHTYRLKNRQKSAALAGAVIFAVGVALSASGSASRTLIASVLAFLGLALLMPHGTILAAGLLRGPIARWFGFPGFLAADNLRKAPQRTAFNVIALGGALSIMVSTAAFIDGMSQDTHRWVEVSLPLDLSITTGGVGGVYSEETLPRSLLARARRVPGVSWAYGVRRVFTPYAGHDIMLLGLQTRGYLEAHRRKGTLGWTGTMAEPANTAAMLSGEGAYVSDNFLALTGRRVGDPIELATPSGPRRFRILGSVDDYSWPRGLVAIDLDRLGDLWRGRALTYVDVQIANPADMDAVRRRLAELTRDEYQANIIDKTEVLAISDDILHQLTAAADVQVWLAAVIGFLGIANSLVIGVMQRQREIGLLRAVGISRRQLQTTVAIEATLIGVASGLFGVGGGLIGGWLPLRFFTFAVSGYLFPPVVPWSETAKVLSAAILIAAVAAIIPARRIAQVPVLTSIAME